MDFWRTVFGLARRAVVALPVLGVATILAAVAYLLVPTYHVSSAAMVLTTPTGGGTLSPKPTGDRTNPLLQFNDSLRTTASILILAMNTPETAAQLGIRPNGDTKITVNDGHTNPDLLAVANNGPFVYIEVRSQSPAASRNIVLEAEQIVRDKLTQRQIALRAPKSTYITVTEVAAPVTKAKRTMKLGAAAGALGMVIVFGLGVAYTVDRVRQDRRARRRGANPRFSSPPVAALPTPRATVLDAFVEPVAPVGTAGTAFPVDGEVHWAAPSQARRFREIGEAGGGDPSSGKDTRATRSPHEARPRPPAERDKAEAENGQVEAEKGKAGRTGISDAGDGGASGGGRPEQTPGADSAGVPGEGSGWSPDKNERAAQGLNGAREQ